MRNKDVLKVLGVATVMALPAAAIADSHPGASETRLEAQPYQVAAGDEKKEKKEKKDKSGLTEAPAPLAHAGAETQTN